MGSIASGVYRVGASMRVDLEYTDLEYTELVLTAEHPLQHLNIPEMNFYARWASLFDRLCLALILA